MDYNTDPVTYLELLGVANHGTILSQQLVAL